MTLRYIILSKKIGFNLLCYIVSYEIYLAFLFECLFLVIDHVDQKFATFILLEDYTNTFKKR